MCLTERQVSHKEIGVSQRSRPCRVRQALLPREAMLALKLKRGLPDVVLNCVLFLNSHKNSYYLLKRPAKEGMLFLILGRDL